MIAAFAPIGLGELVDRAALMTRVDRKYVLPTSRLDDVLALLVPHAQVLEIEGIRDFGYASTYYDDEALTTYHLAAHGRRRRVKVRSRSYAEAGQSFVEVKTRGSRGTTVKERLALVHRIGPWQGLPSDAVPFVQERVRDCGIDVAALRPTLHTAYRRSTLFLPGSGARVTVDSNLAWTVRDGRTLRVDDVVVLETKSGARPSLVDRQLWASGLRPSRISKYGTGLTVLDDRVRGNRWHPVVRRHLSACSTLPSLTLTHDRTAA
jgi:hypothetical protein